MRDQSKRLAHSLPEIPLLDLTTLNAPDTGPAEAVRRAPVQVADILRQARRHYSASFLRLSDRLSQQWLRKSNNPYLAEMEKTAAMLRQPGTYMLNTSFEWACTAGVVRSPAGGWQMLRVLDWKVRGLGRNIIATLNRGKAGLWLNLTWPGFSGVITAMAPGRFAAAINLPPPPKTGLGQVVDWMAQRSRIWRKHGAWPPPHLLRSIFDTSPDYATAKRRLMETPLCTPAFFTLVGPGPSDGCVIERTSQAHAVREAPCAIANHWLDLPVSDRARGILSHERQASMDHLVHHHASPALAPPDWLKPPLLNARTCLGSVLDPATGRATAQGWDGLIPVTKPLSLVV